jgi:hypothetical protein
LVLHCLVLKNSSGQVLELLECFAAALSRWSVDLRESKTINE